MTLSDYGTAVQEYLRTHQPEHLEELRKFLAISSISSLPEHSQEVRNAANWLTNRLKQAGFSVQLIETAGHPVVMGHGPLHPNRPTVLIYGHYDVQPVDPLEAWAHPPFEPTVNNGILYARGSSDDKGQVFLQLLAAEAWLKVAGDDVPVNFRFLFEGEEEIGSIHLAGVIEDHADALQADVAVISDTPMYAENLPAICYGLRGLAALDITVSGPHQDLHSGVYGGMVANPAHALATIIAALHDTEGRVVIPGFYDGVLQLSDKERRAFAELPFDPQSQIEELGVPELFGDPAYHPLERVWAQPTVEINGMWSGFIGKGRKTIIPADAHAKITCRLVPHQDPQDVLRRVQDFIRAKCPPGVRLTIAPGESDPGTLTPIDHPAVQSAVEAITTIYGTSPAFIRMGGSIPVVVTFQEVLNIPTVLLGFALPNENFHAPNEHFHLDNFYKGTQTVANLWQRMADWHPTKSVSHTTTKGANS